MRELGIYIHIPFCKSKCYYCDFISYDNKQDFMELYIDTLVEEIKTSNINEYKIKTVYIGGGTPSILSDEQISKIVNTINCKLEDVEFTIEANPGTVTKEKLENYIKLGINRLSIGLQSTNDELLKNIGRIHNYQQFLNTYNLAREVGFKNINIDLMLGLPNQTLEVLKESVNDVIKLQPEHISIYSLILEENTKLEEMVMRGNVKLPNEECERQMYWEMKKLLEEAGYIHYEISNYAKKGYKSNHNVDCWNQKEYIGFGVAAHSYINKKRYSNERNIEKYLKDYTKKIIHENQTKEDQMKEYMLLGLRKIEGIKISKFKEKFVENPIFVYRKELNKLVEEELIQIEENSIKLTNKGLDFANIVWEEFV